MSSGAGQFFTAFFAALERHDIPYVVLHSYAHLPERIDSDVDYAVRDADISRAHRVLFETAAQTGWLIVQTLQYDIASFYSVLVDPKNPGVFLKLDRCSHYTRNGCLFIRDEVLLEGRRKFNGFFIPALSSEFIYTLAKVFAKGKPPTDYVGRVRELASAEPVRSEKLFYDVFGKEHGRLGEWFDKPPELWVQLSTPMHQRNRYHLPQRLLEWRRRLRRTLQPTGLRTAFLSANDADIPPVIARLEALLEPCFRKQLLLGANSCAGVNSSVWKTLAAFLAEWRRHLLVVWPACRRSTHIVFAGGFEDLAIRSSFARFLSRFLPRPEFTFFLALQKTDQATDAASAKPETSRAAFFWLAARNNSFRLLANSDAESATLAAWQEIIAFLAARDRKRWEHSELK